MCVKHSKGAPESVPPFTSLFLAQPGARGLDTQSVNTVLGPVAASELGVTLPAPAEQLVQGIHAMVHGLIYSWLLDRSFDLEATGAASISAFLRGIGLEPASPDGPGPV